MEKRIGFIGLGAMGLYMAKNLLKGGVNLTVYDINQDVVNDAVISGAKAGASNKDVSEKSDIVITMLPQDEHVRTVLAGEKGVFEGCQPGQIIVDMSTISPGTSKDMAKECDKRGIKYIDAPVSGGTKGAETGTLTIMVGGQKEVYDECMPLFEIMGKNIFHLGDVGTGQTVKMVNQILCAVNMLGISEAFALGVKSGADPEVIYNIIRNSAGNSWQIDGRMPNYVLTGEFTKPGFALDLQLKDIGIAVNTGKELKVPIPVTALAYQLYTAASNSGCGKMDMSSIITLFEEMAGVQVRKVYSDEKEVAAGVN